MGHRNSGHLPPFLHRLRRLVPRSGGKGRALLAVKLQYIGSVRRFNSSTAPSKSPSLASPPPRAGHPAHRSAVLRAPDDPKL